MGTRTYADDVAWLVETFHDRLELLASDVSLDDGRLWLTRRWSELGQGGGTIRGRDIIAIFDSWESIRRKSP